MLCLIRNEYCITTFVKINQMKKITLIFLLFLSVGTFAQQINWKTIEEAETLQKANPNKPLFIDIYTDWCGWCKKMDKTTFLDKSVVKAINDKYIPVKLNAELNKDINFKGHKFSFLNTGKNGVNTLVYHLLQGEMSFPSYVVLTNDGKITNIIRGYFNAKELTEQL